MPWTPELFSAPVLQALEDKRRRGGRTMVPYFDGLLAGEPDALLDSFAGEPEVYDPVRGRVKGEKAFLGFVARTSAWLRERNVVIEDIGHVVVSSGGFEESVLHLDGESGRIAVPVAVTGLRRPDGRLSELRVYHSTWPVTGRNAIRIPLLQPDPDVYEADVVGEYQRALAAGDVEAIVATFEPGGYAREPAGGGYVYRGADALRAFYTRLFSNGGGIPLEHCAIVEDGSACGVEYNVVRWGRTELPPQAGFAVYVRGVTGRLAAVRIYDNVDPPLGRPT
jgi:hypothetical protein